MSNPIYVTGHKNPDTDSIVSAIAYAALKRHHGVDAIAARLGAVSSETEYLLERFGFDEPKKIYTAKCSIHDIKTDTPATATADMTMKEALEKILALHHRGLVVVDEDMHLEGIIALDDLTGMWTMTDEQLERLIKSISIKNLIKTLDGTVVLEGRHELSGKMHMFPSLKSKVEEGSIVVLRNEDDKMLYSLQKGASILVVVTSSPISEGVIDFAAKKNASIIETQLSPLTVTRLMYQVPTIDQVMVGKDDIIHFHTGDTVDDAAKVISQSRYRAYPVLDRNERVVGSISRYHLLTYEKKKYILVDHNEKKQTVDDIDEGEILEIVDHHRMGGFQSDTAININIQPLGATASLIAGMYLEQGIPLEPGMAGILLGAIVSDTMNFKSPTTTEKDKEIAAKLEEICGVSAGELSDGMIGASESILSKRYIEIVFNDFKEFNIDGCKVGLAQSPCKSKSEFMALRDDLKRYLSDTCKTGSYDLLIMMLTNPNGSGSYLISAGSKENVVNSIFDDMTADGFVPDLVSRKKQLLPGVISVL